MIHLFAIVFSMQSFQTKKSFQEEEEEENKQEFIITGSNRSFLLGNGLPIYWF